MKTLTQKEYLADLKAGAYFIGAAHSKDLNEIVAYINQNGYQKIKDEACYKYNCIQKRSKDIVMTKQDGTKCYRDFHGKNEYYTYKQVLLHKNIQDGHTTIFINL